MVVVLTMRSTDEEEEDGGREDGVRRPAACLCPPTRLQTCFSELLDKNYFCSFIIHEFFLKTYSQMKLKIEVPNAGFADNLCVI